MPKLKAVCNRLLWVENTHRYAVKIVDLNAGGKALLREREYAEWWIIEARCFRSARKRNMDFVWDLSRDLVKGKSRDQTDDGVGDPSCNRNQIRICDLRKISETVDTATDLHNLILVAKLVQSSRMDAPSDRFGGVQDSTLSPKDPECRFAGCGCVLHEDSIPRAGYNLLQLSVSADNSIQSCFRNLAASRPLRIEGPPDVVLARELLLFNGGVLRRLQ